MLQKYLKDYKYYYLLAEGKGESLSKITLPEFQVFTVENMRLGIGRNCHW